MEIELDNRNDEIPIFTNESFTFSQKETITANTIIGTVIAKDRDIGDTVK